MHLRRKWRKSGVGYLQKKIDLEKKEKIAWIVFGGLLALQLVCAVVLTYADGDDAFYIPISAATESSGNMYRTIPYTGEATTLDVRHALAPFPVWIAFLSRVSGIHATILAQSILGGVLLVICYLIYDRIAHVLFADNKEGIPVFMLLVSVMILFGNYSFYSAETFLITRASQGKAVLGNLIVPFVVLAVKDGATSPINGIFIQSSFITNPL